MFPVNQKNYHKISQTLLSYESFPEFAVIERKKLNSVEKRNTFNSMIHDWYLKYLLANLWYLEMMEKTGEDLFL